MATADLPALILLKNSRDATFFPSQSLDIDFDTSPKPAQRIHVRMLVREVRRTTGGRTSELDFMTCVRDGLMRDARMLLKQEPQAPHERRVRFWLAASKAGPRHSSVLVPWDPVPGTQLRYFDYLVLSWPEPWRCCSSNADPAPGPIAAPPGPFQVVELRRRGSPDLEPDVVRIWIDKTWNAEIPRRIEHWRDGEPLRIIGMDDWVQPPSTTRWFPRLRKFYDVGTKKTTTMQVTGVDVSTVLRARDTDVDRLLTSF